MFDVNAANYSTDDLLDIIERETLVDAAAKETIYTKEVDAQAKIAEKIKQAIALAGAKSEAEKAGIREDVLNRMTDLERGAKKGREKTLAEAYKSKLAGIPFDFTVRVRSSADPSLSLGQRVLSGIFNKIVGVAVTQKGFEALVVETPKLEAEIADLENEITEIEQGIDNTTRILKTAMGVGLISLLNNGIGSAFKAGINEFKEEKEIQMREKVALEKKRAELEKKKKQLAYQRQLQAKTEDALMQRRQKAEKLFDKKYTKSIKKLLEKKQNIALHINPSDTFYSKALRSVNLIRGPYDKYSKEMIGFQNEVAELRRSIQKFGKEIGVQELDSFLDIALGLDLEADEGNAQPYSKLSDMVADQKESEKFEKAQAAAKLQREKDQRQAEIDAEAARVAEEEAAANKPPSVSSEAEKAAKAEEDKKVDEKQKGIESCKVFLQEINGEEVDADVIENFYDFLVSTDGYPNNFKKYLKDENLKNTFKFFVSGEYSAQKDQPKTLVANPNLRLEFDSAGDLIALFKFCLKPTGGLLNYAEDIPYLFHAFGKMKIPVWAFESRFEDIKSEAEKLKALDEAKRNPVAAAEEERKKEAKAREDKAELERKTREATEAAEKKKKEDEAAAKALKEEQERKKKAEDDAKRAEKFGKDLIDQLKRQAEEHKAQADKNQKTINELMAKIAAMDPSKNAKLFHDSIAAIARLQAEASEKLERRLEKIALRSGHVVTDDSDAALDEGEKWETSSPEVLKDNLVPILKAVLDEAEDEIKKFYDLHNFGKIESKKLKNLEKYQKEIHFLYSGKYKGKNMFKDVNPAPKLFSKNQYETVFQDLNTILGQEKLLEDLQAKLEHFSTNSPEVNDERKIYFQSITNPSLNREGELADWFIKFEMKTETTPNKASQANQKEFSDGEWNDYILPLKYIYEFSDLADLKRFYKTNVKNKISEEKLALLKDFKEAIQFLYTGVYKKRNMFSGMERREVPKILTTGDVSWPDLVKDLNEHILAEPESLKVLKDKLEELYNQSESVRKDYFLKINGAGTNIENKIIRWFKTLRGNEISAASSPSTPAQTPDPAAESAPAPETPELTPEEKAKNDNIVFFKIILGADEDVAKNFYEQFIESKMSAEKLALLTNRKKEIGFLFTGMYKEKYVFEGMKLEDQPKLFPKDINQLSEIAKNLNEILEKPELLGTLSELFKKYSPTKKLPRKKLQDKFFMGTDKKDILGPDKLLSVWFFTQLKDLWAKS